MVKLSLEVKRKPVVQSVTRSDIIVLRVVSVEKSRFRGLTSLLNILLKKITGHPRIT